MKAIEKLALIFMNPFHLDVEKGVGVDVDFVLPFEVCREFQLVFLQIEKAEGSPAVLQLQKLYSFIVPLSRPRKADAMKPEARLLRLPSAPALRQTLLITASVIADSLPH